MKLANGFARFAFELQYVRMARIVLSTEAFIINLCEWQKAGLGPFQLLTQQRTQGRPSHGASRAWPWGYPCPKVA